MSDYLGKQFGNYRLVKLLGEGAFAQVYHGEHIHLGTKTQAAIKVLTAKLTNEGIDLFREEARMIMELEHPHIVRVLDFGIQGGIPYIIMNYAPNGSLRDFYPVGTRLSPHTIVTYIKQIASALQYAHESKQIHRDVKPENLLIGRNNEVLLSDFGLATVAHSTHSLKTQKETAGTIYYMAPEQIQGKPRPASDQYALGVVVYEWLTGTWPFVGSSQIEIALKHLQEIPPPLRNKVPTIPIEVEQVVLKSLAKDPHDRYETIEAFAQALASKLTEVDVANNKQQELALQKVNALKEQGYAFYNLSKYAEAIQVFDQALQINPRDVGALRGKGSALECPPFRHNEALQVYERLLEIDPGDMKALERKGYNLSSLSRHNEALQVYERLLEIDPGDMNFLLQKTYAFVHLGRWEEALKGFVRLLQNDPENEHLLLMKASALNKLNRWEEAIQAWDQILLLPHSSSKYSSNRYSALVSKGNALDKLGRWEKAIQVYDEILQIYPSDDNVLKKKSEALNKLR